jgi:phosphoglycerate dehydrogenase-like enzyme
MSDKLMKLILPHRIADAVEPRIAAAVPDCTIVHVDQEGTPDGDLADAEVLLRWWMPEQTLRRILAAAPKLRWLHTPSAGVDHVLLPEVMEREILITSSSGSNAIPIAEFVLMLMLGHAKRVRALAALTPENAWEQAPKLHLDEIYERTALIIGLGHIGQEIARRAVAFGMRVLGSRRHPLPTPNVERVVGADGWRDLLPEADYVVIAAPLTNTTRGMLDGAAFRRMKRDAYFINIARGEIVDTEALIAALREGRIAGAALDALPEEPLPADHPLWSAPNVWITPHICWSSPRMRERVLDIFVENLRRYRAGEPLLNLVDKDEGY